MHDLAIELIGKTYIWEQFCGRQRLEVYEEDQTCIK